MTSIGDVRNMGADLRDNDGIGEKTKIIQEAGENETMIAWKKIPELAIYDKQIWQKYADHWLEPMEITAKRTPELTYDFVDTRRKDKMFLDTHPSTRQHLIWVEQELKINKLIRRDISSFS